MGKKYIIELNDECNSEFKGIMVFGLTQEQQISVELIPEDSMTPYAEPDLEQVREEAYEDGYKTAKVQCNIQAEKDLREVGEKHYQKGLSDAWEAARKIYLPIEYGGIPADVLRQMFDNKSASGIFKKVSAFEAVEKIRQYEQEKEEIQVGDEVKNTQTDARFIVTHMWENNHGEKGVSGFNYECSAFSTALDLVRKTGRHFPEIAEVLAKMKGVSSRHGMDGTN